MMGYVLSGIELLDDHGPRERRADTALEALRAATAYLREDHRAPIRDDTGQTVTLPELLAAARDQAGPGGGPALATVLAEYIEASRDRDMETAREMYVVLTGPEYESDLLYAETIGDSTVEQRQRDATEREILRDVLFYGGSWREAGRAWADDFGELPPQDVVEELQRWHPDSACRDLVLGAEERLEQARERSDRYQALPAPGGLWGVWSEEDRRFQHVYLFEGVARAHAGALNSGRQWTEKDLGRETRVAVELRIRRTTRSRRTGGATPPTAPPTSQTRRRPGRRP